MKKGGLLFLFLCGFSISLLAKKDSVKHRKVEIIPVPIVYYSPETRFGVGAGASFTFTLHKDSLTNYSQVFSAVAVTQNKQAVAYFPYDLWLHKNDYYIEGEIGFYRYSYFYWGIGTDRDSAELYGVKYPRLVADFYRRIKGPFYLGIDYGFEKDRIVKAQPGDINSNEVLGSGGFTVSGAGIDLLYDTRDNNFFPSKGWFIKGLSYFNFPALGASGSYGRVVTTISAYKQISRPVILAFNSYSVITWGDVPFNQLGLLGAKQFRGYYYGYYRDYFLTLIQAESRIHIAGRWGIDFFGGTALLGHRGDFPTSNCPVFAEGFGLRYNANLQHHLNIRADVGYGVRPEFYLSVEEAF